MRIFKTTWFARFADREGITDSELREAVNQLEAGHADADLEGGVYKIRVARSGEGKSGSYRVIVFFKSKARTFFYYGFAIYLYTHNLLLRKQAEKSFILHILQVLTIFTAQHCN